MTTTVKNYLTRDLNREEKLSYVNYLRGDENDTLWIEKAMARKDYLLLNYNLVCPESFLGGTCNSSIDIRENGSCVCTRGHNCERTIEHIINQDSSINMA